VAIGGLDLPALILDLAEQPRILNRQGRLGSERLEKVDDFRRKLPASFRQTALGASAISIATGKFVQAGKTFKHTTEFAANSFPFRISSSNPKPEIRDPNPGAPPR
jgi:hypothetical protein